MCRLLAVLTLVGSAGCRDDRAGTAVEVSDAWTRPTPRGSTTAAVYMTVRAGHDDTLVDASVDPAVAGDATAHETDSSSGQVSMDDSAGVELPGGEDVAFEPGGLHVMLEDLAAPLGSGSTFALTLAFEHAPDLEVTVDVREEAS